MASCIGRRVLHWGFGRSRPQAPEDSAYHTVHQKRGAQRRSAMVVELPADRDEFPLRGRQCMRGSEEATTMKKVLWFILATLSLPANATSLIKTYSYFSIGGKTLAQIE